jgi:hypothetical protein
MMLAIVARLQLATKEMKKGKFTLPGACELKIRTKPATKAGKKMMFGNLLAAKAKPTKTVIKARNWTA